MPLFQSRSILRHALVSLVSGSLIVGPAVSVQAGDEPGLGGLLQQLFSPSRPAEPVQQLAPPAQVQSPSPTRYYGRRHAQRAEGKRLRPKIRYAALPKSEPEPLKVRVTDRQTPLEMKDGSADALLRDETLKPGDIVVLKEGASVFTGQPGKRHVQRDFESVSHSDRVDHKTRKLLAGMIAPRGALPADEARKAVARLKRSAPHASEPVQAQASVMRVIYPSNSAP
jgi:hypothetical protein